MKKLISIIIAVIIIASCKKSTEDLVLTPISDYAPLTVGKYITYSLDSLTYTNFGTTETHRIYEVRYVTADTLTDILGRKAYRIVRYIRSIPAGTFTPDNTFLAVNTGSTFEFTENNLRYIKLIQPIKEENSWKGNSAIDVTTVIPGVRDFTYLADWDYTYAGVGQASPLAIGSFSLPNTITVNQRNTSTNLPVTATTNIASKDFSREIYAKGIGMVYREFLHWEFQQATNYTGYGVTLKMIDRN
jgi:hypothetical protein